MADAYRIPLGAPFDWITTASTVGFSSFTLDGTTDQLEWVFQADDAITITHLGFRYGARTGTPPTFIISLQGVDGSGNPDGTIKGGGSPASATFTPPADATWDGTWQWIALANSFTVARGDMLAIVIAYSSGTINGSNSSAITARLTNLAVPASPYVITNNAGSRTRGAVQPIFGYKSATRAYGYPLETITVTAFSSDSTPDEYAMKFTVPTGWGSSLAVLGVQFPIQAYDAAKTLQVTLYDTDGTTVLQRITLDSDYLRGLLAVGRATVLFDEVTLSALTIGSAYRVGLAPQETASNFQPYRLQVDAAADWDAWPFAQQAALSTRTDAGAWTDDTTQRLQMDLLLADITEPSASVVSVTSQQAMVRAGYGVVGY